MSMIREKTGTLKTLNTTPYISEQSLTPTQAPTAISTGTPQASWTFSKTGMAPYFSGNVSVLSYKPIFGINLAGQNTSGAAVTVFHQVNKNGTLSKSGSVSVNNNYYFTSGYLDAPNEGDVYDIYIWSSATTGLNYLYQNSWCSPSRVNTGVQYMSNYSITLSSPSSTIFPVAGNKVNNYTLGSVYTEPSTLATTNTFYYSTTTIGTINFPLFTSNPTLGLFLLAGGDINGTSASIAADSSTYKMYLNYYVSSLSYREIFFR